MTLNYVELEPKWQKAWNEAKIYEPEPDDRKPMLVTVAFPYVNTPLHIGHLRTYSVTDFYARYKRHRGYNILFPMGFHATGTPILAVAKRIAAGDKGLIEDLKKFEIPDEDIAKMADINFNVDYMIKITENSFRHAGLGIDWRRKFKSTEPIFSKMVEWQFKRLNELGLLKQGSHPVGWCPNENNAVGQHDTKGDMEPEIEELIAVGFRDVESDLILPCTTYRPETIDGVTNLFVGEKINYVIARIGDKRYCISGDVAKGALPYQFDLKIEGQISADELLKKTVINPSNGEQVPVLPGFFVEGNVGTGIVMSVPAHAPFDHAALENLANSGYPLPRMEERSVVKIQRPDQIKITDSDISKAKAGDLNVPAAAYLEMVKREKNPTDDMLQNATKLVYREEARWGVMSYGKYAGKSEIEARSLITFDLLEAGNSFKMYELTNEKPVFCRCGTKIVVKKVDGQWFINYGDAEWKAKTRAHMEGMKLYPEGSLNTFEKVLDWINMRATERSQGLGTPFPLNKEHIIESLSDSTIYMTLYTYVHILRDAQIKPEQLKPEFFDFVLDSKGSAADVAAATGIDEMVVKRCHESFKYWCSDTSRHSGSDLIYSHLVMYVFNHVALFSKAFWPRQIVTNGLVNYEGQKMSKSLGNIVPLDIAIRKYGVDPLRFVEVVGSDIGTESDFRTESVRSVQAKNDFFHKLILSLPEMKSTELSHSDFWLYSKLNSKIKTATERLDNFSLKDAYIEIFYNSATELKKYLDRGGSNGMLLREFLEKVAIMISPVMPHVAEEFWHELGKTSFVVKEEWPSSDESMINTEAEEIEDLIDSTISDVRQGIELTSKITANQGKNVREIRIIIADDWKRISFNLLCKEKNISKVMSSTELAGIEKEKLSKFLSPLSKRMNSLVPVSNIPSASIVKSINESAAYLSEKLGAQLSAVMESESKSERASRAGPGKPAIDIVWE